MKGTEWLDSVCLSQSTCVDSFEFFLISDMKGLEDRIDGILGLSRSSVSPELMREAWRGIGPTYIKHLADAGAI